MYREVLKKKLLLLLYIGMHNHNLCFVLYLTYVSQTYLKEASLDKTAAI